MTDEKLSFNRLSNESSLYLQQHKDKPVHWYPFGEEALQKAKSDNKPILLSVGYSTCHWCHVMGLESFSDQETADYINANFIPILVDKEEHPDIDTYYQQACHMFGNSGGWPLNAFLLPDTRPYFIGTYFSNIKKGEAPAFKDILVELSSAYSKDQSKVEENAKQVTEALSEEIKPPQEIEYQGHFPHPMAIYDALKEEHLDSENGGFKGAPKFPHYSFFEWASEQILEGMLEEQAGHYIVKTIDNMLFGGLYDHARGGVHRYSTDEKYLIPHFEKMLFDQAGFLSMLSKVSKFYQAPHVFDALMDTLGYLESEMLSDEGTYFTAQDADSEGLEGLYFTFTLEEFEDLLKEASIDDDIINDNEFFQKAFRVTKEGNYERGLNVISLDTSMKEELFTEKRWDQIRRIRKEIMGVRKQRIPPKTDTKCIGSWNAALISALTDVMQYCPVDPIKFKANELLKKSLEGFFKTFIMRNDEGKVKLRHASTIHNEVSLLEDYAHFSHAQLRLFELTSNEVFKNNFMDTLDFIMAEFFKDGFLHTRAIPTQDLRPYPNQKMSPFDQTLKSPAALVYNLVKRARVLNLDGNIGESLESGFDWLKQTALLNPVVSGESLRLSTYPQDVYRRVTVPRKWIENNMYIGFMGNLLSRFVINYQEQEGVQEKWEISTIDKGELQGETLEEFIQALTPKQPKQEESKQKEDK